MASEPKSYVRVYGRYRDCYELLFLLFYVTLRKNFSIHAKIRVFSTKSDEILIQFYSCFRIINRNIVADTRSFRN